MTTSRDIIERAYRKIGVVAGDEPMTADQGANGLDAMNMMMHGWELQGVNIGHFDLAISDTFTLPNRFAEGTVYQLAQRLAPDMQVQGVNADEWLRQLQAYYLLPPAVTLPPALLQTASQRRYTR